MASENLMNIALKEAQKAFDIDEVPIGAIVVCEEKVIGFGHNHREKTNAISRHAEIIALEMAANYLGTWKLNNCQLYTTLEPCLMCYGAIRQSRISQIFIAARGNSDKEYTFSKYIPANQYEQHIKYGLGAKKSQELLKKFFKKKRSKGKND